HQIDDRFLFESLGNAGARSNAIEIERGGAQSLGREQARAIRRANQCRDIECVGETLVQAASYIAASGDQDVPTGVRHESLRADLFDGAFRERVGSEVERIEE